jgi:hypothetical protein
MNRLLFSLSGWLLMFLFGIVILNLCLIFFVAALDIFLGQPPQIAVPFFALLVSLGGLLLNRSTRVRSKTFEEARQEYEQWPSTSRQTIPDAPAYLSMTVIRRPVITAQHRVADNWEETIQ